MCNLVSAVANTEQRKCNLIWNHALNCTQNCTCYQPRTLEVDGGLYWHRLPLFQHEIICLLYAIFVSITFFSLFPFRLLTLLRSYVTFLDRARYFLPLLFLSLYCSAQNQDLGTRTSFFTKLIDP
jgi:hypothetical protein